MATRWDSAVKTAATLGGGGSSRSDGPKRKSKVLSQAHFSKLIDADSGVNVGGKVSSDLPEITKRALKNEFGAKRAQSALKKIQKSSMSKEEKKKWVKFYENGGDAPKGKSDDSLLHKLTHNQVTDAMGTGLMLIDKPKRAVVATLQELDEEFSGLEDDGKSWADNVLREESYGFGEYVEQSIKTGEKKKGSDGDLARFARKHPNVGRGLGLAGDIALDPTTYVAAGAVAKGVKAGEGGAEAAIKGGARLRSKDLARRAATAAKDAATVAKDAAKAGDTAKAAASAAKAGELETLAARLLKRGTGGATEAEMAQVGAEGGLRLGGRKLVGQDKWGKVTKLTAPVKEALGDSAGMRAFTNVVGDDTLTDFRLAMRSKDSSDGQIVDALLGMDAKKGGRRVATRFGAIQAVELEGLLKKGRKAKLQGAQLRGAVSGDLAAFDAVEKAVPGLTKDLRAFFAKTREGANDLAPEKWINDAGEFYTPSFMTDEAIEVITKKSPTKETKKGARSFTQRAAKSGDDFGDQVLGSNELHERFSQGMVRESQAAINAQVEGLLKEWSPGLKQVYTNDLYSDAPKYLKGVSNAVAVRAEAKGLVDRGVATLNPLEAVPQTERLSKALRPVGEAATAAKGARRESDKLSAALASVVESRSKAQLGMEAADDAAGGVVASSDDVVTRLLSGVPEGTPSQALDEEGDGLAHMLGRLLAQRDDEAAGLDDLAARLDGPEAMVADYRQGLEDVAADTAKPLKNASVRRQRGAVAVLRDQAALDEAIAARSGVSVARKTLAATKARLRQAEREVKNLGTSRAKAKGSLVSLDEGVVRGTPQVRKAQRTVAELRPKFDSFADAAKMARADSQVMFDEAVDRLAVIEEELVSATNRDAARARALSDVAVVRRSQVQVLERLAKTSDVQAKRIFALDAQAKELEAQHLEALTKAVGMEDFVRQMKKPELEFEFKHVLQGAMESMAQYGLNDYNLSKFHMDAMERAVEVAKSPGKFLRFVDLSNRFFKTYAILTPGFHVRNSVGAMFNNYVGGVTIKSYYDVGFNLKRYRSGGLAKVKPDVRPIFARLEKEGFFHDNAQVASELGEFGGGMNAKRGWATADLSRLNVKGVSPGHVGPIDNPVTRLSRETGDHVEKLQRTVLAYDRMRKGATFEEAWDAVSQFHFDYSDLSKVEVGVVKRVIPFWTWTSRNMPLQLEMVMRQPKAYQRFGAIKNAVQSDEDDPELVPSWIKDNAAAIHTGGNNYLTLDLPFTGVDEQTRGITDNGALAVLQNASPLAKTPIEIGFGKQAFNNIPITDKRDPEGMPESWAAVPGLVPLLQTAGLINGEKGDNGRYLISNKSAYIVEQALPLAGRARRLAPSEEKYQQRKLASWMSFFGVGFRTVTDADKQAETWKRGDTLTNRLDRFKETQPQDDE